MTADGRSDPAVPLVYLDHAATTPLDPEVLATMAQVAQEAPGNASAVHRAGTAAAKVVERGRAVVAAAMGAEPDEIIFTAGGTEANNAALWGVLQATPHRHALCSAVEHPSVVQPLRWLTRLGVTFDLVPVDHRGVVDPARVAQALRPDTALVSVMHVNNELGVVQPIADIAALCRRQGVLFHTDACQSFTKVPLEVRRLGVDLVSLNAHKLHGPKGVGALYVRRGVRLEPLLHGGGQEGGRRAGTANTPGIAGLSRAVELSGPAAWDAVAARRDRLARGLGALPGVTFNGIADERVANILSVTIAGVAAKELLQELSARGICASAGSACAGGKDEPSAVLQALGLAPAAARSTVRFSLGRTTTDEEIATAVSAVTTIVTQLRAGRHDRA